MTAADILALLGSLGARVTADSGGLHFKAPPGAVSPELRAEIAEYRAELMALLAAPAPPPPAADPEPEPRARALTAAEKLQDARETVAWLRAHGLSTLISTGESLTDWLAGVEAELGADAPPEEPADPAPPWEGQRVALADLADFKQIHGLVTVGSEWPEGEPRPLVYMERAK